MREVERRRAKLDLLGSLRPFGLRASRLDYRASAIAEPGFVITSSPQALLSPRVRSWVALSIAIAVFAAVVIWTRSSSDVRTAPSDNSMRPAPSNEVAVAADADGVRAPSPTSDGRASAATSPEWPALPPVETPLAEVLDELVDRARRGDNKAACRLGAELQRCHIAWATRSMASDVEGDVSRRRDVPDAAVDAIARLQVSADRRGEGCSGVAFDQLKTAFQWQKQAALANPELRVAFALAPALDPRDFVNELDAWGEYRALALPWLEAAAAEGDVSAVIALARVHGDMRRTGPRVPPFRIEDDERFVVFADLMQRYGSRVDIVTSEAAAARERLSPEAQERARARSDALFRPDKVLDAGAANEAMRSSLQATLAPEKCDG